MKKYSEEETWYPGFWRSFVNLSLVVGGLAIIGLPIGLLSLIRIARRLEDNQLLQLRDRETQILQHILVTYFEDEKVTRDRRFVYKYMTEVNKTILTLPLDAESAQGRAKINAHIREIVTREQLLATGEVAFGISNVLAVVNSMNHLCMFLEESTLSGDC